MTRRPLVTVGGLVVASDGEILLVQSKKWHDLYSLPGGKVEWGESREEAFKREIWEETQLKVTNLRFAVVQDCIFSHEFWKRSHFVMNDFIADLDSSSSKDHVQLNHEAFRYEWIAPQNALKLNLQRECRLLIEWYLKQETKQSRAYHGIIGIHQYQINCIVGIYPEERQKEQALIIDAKIKIDLSSCFRTGSLDDTINYVLLAQLCSELAQQNKYQLLETFAFDILDQSINRFNASWAWVRIQKPSAIPFATYAFVEFERYQEKG